MKIIRTIFLICFFICFIFAIKYIQLPETNLLNAFITTNQQEGNYISKLSAISNNRLNIIIESNNIENNEDLKNTIENKLADLSQNDDIIKSTIMIYKNYPGNFLTLETQKLLKDKNYKQIEEQSLKMLYNPLGIFISPPDKDPYLFATDFALNNQRNLTQDFYNIEGKIYSLLTFENKDIKNIKIIKNFIEELKKDDTSKIYLSGSPVHTYETQNRSNLEINIFCILSILMVMFLCKHCFGNIKIILPIGLSIVFGLLFGFTFTSLICRKIHILTFVFSTSLIGISLDYSLHYYLSGKDKEFKKSLLVSFLSTIMTFAVLYFSGIEILKQIAIFVSLGLFGVYLFVCHILPMFQITCDISNIKTPVLDKYKKIILFIVCIVVIFGLFKTNFNDSIKNLYKPTKKLLQAETVYNKIFNNKQIGFILVNGKNTDEIIEKEEIITQNLYNQKTDYLSLSRFMSSTKKQKENLELVNNLYKTRLNIFADFIDKESKQKIITNKEIYNPKDFPLNEKFMLDKNTSFIMISDPSSEYKTLNISDEMTQILKNFRMKCLRLIPAIFLLILIVLKFFYNWKQTFKIIIPSFSGGLFALSIISLFNIELNVFHLLAFILSLGFSMDYSIFRAQNSRNSEYAVMISCISTVFSFLLLSFTGFKLISSIGIVLSIGILTSYILSLLIISNNIRNGKEQ